MGMCVMYSFCKYGPGALHCAKHEVVDDEPDDSPRSGSSSAGSLMLESESHDAERSYEQHPALWKRTIPKGRRCEPLDFSGLILYDEHGNRLQHCIAPDS